MSWHFLEAGVVASWEQSSLVGAPSALLKLIPMLVVCCSTGNVTASCLPSRSGTTCEHSMATAGVGISTWLREGSRVRTLASLVPVKGSMELEAACGSIWLESFARYDPDLCSWKTQGLLLTADSMPYLGTWPEWGSMRNGVCLKRAPGVRHRCGPECSYWPAPTATMAKSGFGHGKHSKARYRSSVLTRCAEIGWCGHPDMLEAVQGWPIGWTARESLAMDRYREWLRVPGRRL